jgi:hypothetical protein
MQVSTLPQRPEFGVARYLLEFPVVSFFHSPLRAKKENLFPSSIIVENKRQLPIPNMAAGHKLLCRLTNINRVSDGTQKLYFLIAQISSPAGKVYQVIH